MQRNLVEFIPDCPSEIITDQFENLVEMDLSFNFIKDLAHIKVTHKY